MPITRGKHAKKSALPSRAQVEHDLIAKALRDLADKRRSRMYELLNKYEDEGDFRRAWDREKMKLDKQEDILQTRLEGAWKKTGRKDSDF